MPRTRGKQISFSGSWNLAQQRLDEALELAQQKQLLSKYEREKNKKMKNQLRKNNQKEIIKNSSLTNSSGDSDSVSVTSTIKEKLILDETTAIVNDISLDDSNDTNEINEFSSKNVPMNSNNNNILNGNHVISNDLKKEVISLTKNNTKGINKIESKGRKKHKKRSKRNLLESNDETINKNIIEIKNGTKDSNKLVSINKGLLSLKENETSFNEQKETINEEEEEKTEDILTATDNDQKINNVIEKLVVTNRELLPPCFECGSQISVNDRKIFDKILKESIDHKFNNIGYGNEEDNNNNDNDDEYKANCNNINRKGLNPFTVSPPFIGIRPEISMLGKVENQSQKKKEKLKLGRDELEKLFEAGGGTGACLHPVEILDVRSQGMEKRYNELINNGIPVVLVGHHGFTAFSDDWVINNELCVENFLDSCGDAKGPIARHGYEGNQISKETMLISSFVENLFSSNDNSLYLAQWQFPLDIFKSLKKSNSVDDMISTSVSLSEQASGRRSSSRKKRGLINPKWLSSILPDCTGFDMLQHSYADIFMKPNLGGNNFHNSSNTNNNNGSINANNKRSFDHLSNINKGIEAKRQKLDNKGNRNISSKQNEIISNDNENEKLDISPVNPYQYLFLGGPLTYTQLHNDPGGMSILIAPIVGEKEVVLIHRDDLDLPYDIECRYENGEEPMDGNRFPGIMMVRSWKVVLTPGDILVMPPRTFHAVRNLTPSLAYSRCHFGPNELLEMMRSYFVDDSPELYHKRVIWNAAHALMEELSNDPSKAWKYSSDSLIVTSRLQGLKGETASSKLIALRAIRSCATMFLNFFEDIEIGNQSECKVIDEDEYDWQGLLYDINYCLEICGDDYSITQPNLSKQSKDDEYILKQESNVISKNSDSLLSKSPPTTLSIKIGDVVALNPSTTCPDRLRRWSTVIKIELKKPMIYIRYLVFGPEKNELVPIESVIQILERDTKAQKDNKKKKPGISFERKRKRYHRNTQSQLNISDSMSVVSERDGQLKVGDIVCVPWKVSDDLIEETKAEILSLHEDDAVLLQFHMLGPEFNQWHVVKDITYTI